MKAMTLNGGGAIPLQHQFQHLYFENVINCELYSTRPQEVSSLAILGGIRLMSPLTVLCALHMICLARLHRVARNPMRFHRGIKLSVTAYIQS